MLKLTNGSLSRQFYKQNLSEAEFPVYSDQSKLHKHANETALWHALPLLAITRVCVLLHQYHSGQIHIPTHTAKCIKRCVELSMYKIKTVSLVDMCMSVLVSIVFVTSKTKDCILDTAFHFITALNCTFVLSTFLLFWYLFFNIFY